jgi:septal ring factor EnvC (AmiA/AmiB activator)
VISLIRIPIVAGVALAGLAVGAAIGWFAHVASSDRQSAEEIEAIRINQEAILKLAGKIQALEAELNALRQQRNENEARIAELEGELAGAEVELSRLRKEHHAV